VFGIAWDKYINIFKIVVHQQQCMFDVISLYNFMSLAHIEVITVLGKE
jgi:hypothetical protein